MTASVGGVVSTTPPPGRYVAHTEPYPWPYNGLRPARLGLVIAGAQRFWVDRTDGVDDALAALDQLASAVRDAGGRVFVVAHTAPSASRRAGYLPASGTDDAPLVVDPSPVDTVVTAGGLSGAFAGSLESALRAGGVDQVLIAGLGLEGPVHSTLRDLNDQGYECLLVTDACAYGSSLTRAAAISTVTMSGGIFGAVGQSGAVVAALREEQS